MVKVSDFVSEYKTVADPSKREKAQNWDIAIGLQRVDGLRPSKYLYQVARENIDGKLSHDKVYETLHKYYQTDAGRADGEGTKEADLVSNRIAELLGNPSFTFAPGYGWGGFARQCAPNNELLPLDWAPDSGSNWGMAYHLICRIHVRLV